MHGYIKLGADATMRAARCPGTEASVPPVKLDSYPADLKDSITNITCAPVIVRPDGSTWTCTKHRILQFPSTQ